MTITTKAEKALASYLRPLAGLPVASASVFTGIEDDSRVLPCVVVHCVAASPSNPQIGIWIAEVNVTLQSNADETTESQHLANSEALFDLVGKDSLAALLSQDTSDAFYCYGAELSGMQTAFVDRRWETTISFKLTCSGVDTDGAPPIIAVIPGTLNISITRGIALGNYIADWTGDDGALMDLTGWTFTVTATGAPGTFGLNGTITVPASGRTTFGNLSTVDTNALSAGTYTLSAVFVDTHSRTLGPYLTGTVTVS